MSVDTRARILDAAEELFAVQGISGTSLRSVTKKADVNLAAVHYHFGSKLALCQAVLARRVAPVNQQRLQVLEQIEARAIGEAPLPLEEIVQAFINPVLQLKRDLEGRGPIWSHLIGRFYSEPIDLIQPLLKEQFSEVGQRFVTALQRALPDVPQRDVHLRFQLMVAVLTHVLIDLHRIEVVPLLQPQHPDDELLQNVCLFLAAGFRAPVSGPSGSVFAERCSQ